MTKKHFIEFARKIKQQLELDKFCSPTAFKMAQMICDVAKQDNPRFDEVKFLKACGLN